jgi:hypothetical protein
MEEENENYFSSFNKEADIPEKVIDVASSEIVSFSFEAQVRNKVIMLVISRERPHFLPVHIGNL